MPDIVIDYECPLCGGTGLYRGCCEKDGAAVVCNSCNGTGKCTFRAKPFTGQKVARGVERVFDSSHGYGVTSKDVITADGVELPFSQWGCTYEEWLAGATPVPLKGLVCPFWQDQDNRTLLGDKCHGVAPGRSYLSCRHFKDCQ
jgi:hypothetical protein